jgi:tripartite-type tricarboxylate transporter receptor subunit TctC
MPRTIAIAAIIGVISAGPGHAQSINFAGKTLTLMAHTPPGGGYDAYVRLLSRHIGNSLPGNPHTVVVNKPGAGGYTAANHLGSLAPRDGTFMALMQQSILLDEALGKSVMQVSERDLNWIGNLSQSNNLLAVWHAIPVKTIDDAGSRETTVGASGSSSTAAQLPALLNAVLGTRFRVIHGYEGGAAIDLAMQRGEVEGRGANTWASYKSTSTALVREGKLTFLVQVGRRKEPELPNVPLLTDLVKGDAAKEQAARFVSLAFSIARPLAAPPGVPADVVKVLRRAFDATVKDASFLEEANRTSLEVDPMTGEEVEAGVRQVLSTPPEVVSTLRAVFEAK